jgi:hypothetical protein
VIEALRLVASVPFTVAGFFLTSVGEALSALAYRVEGVPSPFDYPEEVKE